MSRKFLIFDISLEQVEKSETLGTKVKFWFKHSKFKKSYLFKKSRQNTGEDWAEKIAAELCNLIRLPHADYELATFNNENGTVSPSFLLKNSSLVLGNEILAKILLDYPTDTNNPSQHTLNNIFRVFNDSSVCLPIDWTPLDGITTAIDVFIGYLLLDAWIGNSDRHHENWAFIDLEGKSYLAPTYDHASSLGRNESDKKRQERLITRDKSFSVETYADKCQSCLYAKVGDRKPLKTFEAFCEAAKLYPQAANIWLNSLKTVSTNDTLTLFERIPEERISPTAIKFAQKILEINQNKLIEFSKELL